jgi:hypothetical protein
MKIFLSRGCIHDWLGINQKSELSMTTEERKEYFDEIVEKMRGEDIDEWFNPFLQWVCETFGEYECADEPCEQCGDIVETYEVEF